MVNDNAYMEQALPHLKENLPIERAKMRLKIQVPVSCRADLIHYLNDKQATVESEDLGIRSNQVGSCLPYPC